ncbi:ComEA family DNA-binding protein [Fibrobacter sp. UWH4]|uniref:ComEA family DNA-binding protein n=1 Tax=Fibrobacter sp. UWH4 TaxID=1896210 RepID=UPI000918B7BA|nr:ComEA family DNA-binding protein [Fibrobacter sp. UWH4]SHK78701.1 competence protein ComEA [Fibrobacter sp. UWH4]
MNGPEKNVVRLALCLLVLGIVMRYLPWGLPSIDTFEVGDALIVSADSLALNAGGNLSSDSIVSKIDSIGYSSGQKTQEKHPRMRKTAPKVALPIHINTASVDELCALKGVGPKLAEKIIAAREAHGPFKSGADLQKVPGIGKKKLENMISGVNFD